MLRKLFIASCIVGAVFLGKPQAVKSMSACEVMHWMGIDRPEVVAAMSAVCWVERMIQMPNPSEEEEEYAWWL